MSNKENVKLDYCDECLSCVRKLENMCDGALPYSDKCKICGSRCSNHTPRTCKSNQNGLECQ